MRLNLFLFHLFFIFIHFDSHDDTQQQQQHLNHKPCHEVIILILHKRLKKNQRSLTLFRSVFLTIFDVWIFDSIVFGYTIQDVNKKRNENLIQRLKIHEKQIKRIVFKIKGALCIVCCRDNRMYSLCMQQQKMMPWMTWKIIEENEEKKMLIQINVAQFFHCLDNSIDFVAKMQYSFRLWFYSHSFFLYTLMMNTVQLSVNLNIIFGIYFKVHYV